MDIEQFMKDRNLFGMISEPSPYYWERVKKAIEDAYELGKEEEGFNNLCEENERD